MNKIVIQYQTHQVLTNKNSLTEMNCQLLKTEATQPNNTEQTLRKFNENYEWKKDYLTITKKQNREESRRKQKK